MAAIATSLSYLLMFAMIYFHCKKIVRLEFDLEEIAKIIGSAIIGGLSTWFAMLNISSDIRFLALFYLIILYLISYTIALIFFNSKLIKIKQIKFLR